MFVTARGLLVLLTIPVGFVMGWALFEFAPWLSDRKMGIAFVGLGSGILSAALTWAVGARLNRPRNQFDRATGETLVLRNPERFLWIPMQWWAAAPLLGTAFWIYLLAQAYNKLPGHRLDAIPLEITNELGWSIIDISKPTDNISSWVFTLRDHSLKKVKVKLGQQVGPWTVSRYQYPNLILINAEGSKMILPPYGASASNQETP
jgi:hypothetical protein